MSHITDYGTERLDYYRKMAAIWKITSTHV